MYTQIQIAYLHFALFGSYGINAKNTNFIFGTSPTHGNRYTQAHAHAQTHTDTETFLHFALFGSSGIHAKDTNFIFGTPQTYICIDT